MQINTHGKFFFSPFFHKQRFCFFLLAIITLFLQGSFMVSAAVYGGNEYTEVFYVCVGGDGSDPEGASCLSAWSLAQASDVSNWDSATGDDGKIGPGDAVVFLDDGGAFTSRFTVRQSGLLGSPISFLGEAGGFSEIDVADTNAVAFNIWAKSYITIKDLTLSGGTARALDYHYGGSTPVSHIVLENIVVRDSAVQGARLAGSDYTVTSSTFSGNGGVGLRIQDSDGLIFRNNVVDANGHYTGSSNEDGFECDGCENYVIEDNVFSNGTSDMGSGLDINTGPSVGNASGTIRRNKFIGNDENGLSLKGLSDVAVYNNLFIGNKKNMTIESSADSTVIENNVFYGDSATLFLVKIACDSGTGLNFRGNIVWGNASEQTLRYDPDCLVSANNNIWKTGDSGFLSNVNTGDVDTWEYWKSVSGEGNSTLDIDPVFVNAGNSDFSLQASSPAIDAGVANALTQDFFGNPVYGLPDIGAVEYQPPYDSRTDDPDITANVRIYGNGAFRNTDVPSGTTARLSVKPAGNDLGQYIDLVITAWENTGTRHKSWSESSDTVSGHVDHTVGDLEPGLKYILKVDGIEGNNIVSAQCSEGLCVSDAQGEIVFTYTGTYSTHTFDVEEGDNVVSVTNSSGNSGGTRSSTDHNLIPNNNAKDVPVGTALNWKRKPDGTQYIVYLGKDKKNYDDTPYATTTQSKLLLDFPLEELTTYYWRVDVDSDRGKSRGVVYKFTTGENILNTAQDSVSQNEQTSAESRTLSERIHELMVLIEKFKQQLLGDKGVSAQPQISRTGFGVLTSLLKPGMTGAEVRSLQEKLNTRGYQVSASGPGSPGFETTFFGQATLLALKNFQCVELSVCSGTPETTGYGQTGPLTRSALN